MSKSNLHSSSGSLKSEIIRLQEYMEMDDAETYSPSVSSFDENFNCDEMFIVTIDDRPNAPHANSTLSNSDNINLDRKQFVTNASTHSLTSTINEAEIRQIIKDVRFTHPLLLLPFFSSFDNL